MFKNIISPIQEWLISQGRCGGCGNMLVEAKKEKDLLVCKCGRIFKENVGSKSQLKTYRRARLDEVK